MKFVGAIALAVLTCGSASAQQALIVGGAQGPVLRSGTEIQMKMAEGLTTEGKHLRVGQRFALEVSEPVTLNGHIVIPAGTHGTGEVTEVRNKGMWGKSGGISARAVSLQVGDRSLRLTGSLNDKGKTGTAGVVGAVAFVPVAGFFVTGTSARIPVGAPVKAFLDEDVPVSFADSSAAPTPLVAEAPSTPVGSAGPAAPKK